MYDFQSITPNRTAWEDDIPGFQGNEGWWEETPTHRIIFFYGVWWDDNKGAPHKGKGDLFAVTKILPRKFLNGYAHGGFASYADKALKYLSMAGILNTEKPLIIAGHSLGGAVASLVALALIEAGRKVDDVVLYACPTAWGSPKLVRAFRKFFPEARNHIVGNDYTQFTHILTLPFMYGSPAPIVKYRRKYYSFLEYIHSPVDDHWPWVMAGYVPKIEK